MKQDKFLEYLKNELNDAIKDTNKALEISNQFYKKDICPDDQVIYNVYETQATETTIRCILSQYEKFLGNK